MIPYGRQSISEADIAAVVEVLRSDLITQGQLVPQFEASVAEFCSARHAVAVSSGTAALHLSCLALGLGPGDWLWTSPITFVASANCARYCGARVDFVDIEPQTLNTSVSALRSKLAQAKIDGTLPKIVVPVHFAGQPCDMKGIAELASEYGFSVVEDASHALGAGYEGKPVGDCRYSEITVFSFHPVKMITTGEGGMAMSNSSMLAERIATLRSHGIARDVSLEQPWRYEQRELGFNYRLTDIQAALGLSQMGRLEAFLNRRKVLAARYDEQLVHLPLKLPLRTEGYDSSWHLYIVQLTAGSPLTRDSLYQEMRSAGIGVNVHYIPVHSQPYYQALGFYHGQFPHAEAYYEQCLTLPLSPATSDAQQQYVIETLCRIFDAAK